MWLPEPIYKSLPTLYAAMGACFILGVFYLGFDAPMSPVYLAMGLVSVIASVVVSIWRSAGSNRRGDNNHSQNSEEEQTT